MYRAQWIFASISVSEQNEHLHTTLYKPFLIGLGLGKCKHTINGAFPLPDSDSYSDYYTDSDSMQKCSTGTDSHGDSYTNHGHFASLFKKLIVASIDPILACLVIPTTGLYNNSHSFNN